MASSSSRSSSRIRPTQPITEFRTPYGTVSRTRSISSKNNKKGYLGNNERNKSPRTRRQRVFLPFPTNEYRRKAAIEAATLTRLANRQKEFDEFLIQEQQKREAASARRNTRPSLKVNESFLNTTKTNPSLVKTYVNTLKISNSPSIFGELFKRVRNPTSIQGGTRKKRRSGTAKNLIRY